MFKSLAVASWLGCVAGQFTPQLNAGTPGISAGNSALNGSKLCNRNFADANASGIVTFDPDLSSGQSLLPATNGTLLNPVSWAVTVYQSPNTTASDSLTELSLWFSPDGKNYSNNYALGYDVCYFWISALNINSFERGQDDDGSCMQTMDEQCVNDLQTMTDQYAVDLVGNPSPGPNSNLTENSLPIVCGNLANSLTKNFPQSCEVFFNSTRAVYGGTPALGGPLTGPLSYVDRSFCQMNGSYSMMWSQYGPATEINYLVANYWVTPIITAFMPIADANRPATLGLTKSFTSCIRAKNLNNGSQPIPVAPSPTPINTAASSSSTLGAAANSTSPANSQNASGASSSGNESSDLSGGAIAGIVVGVILGLAAVAAVMLLFFRKRIAEAMDKRRRARKSIAELDGGAGYVEMDQKVPPAELSGHTAAEMDSSSVRAELGDNKEWVSEMPTYRERQAINRQPAELG